MIDSSVENISSLTRWGKSVLFYISWLQSVTSVTLFCSRNIAAGGTLSRQPVYLWKWRVRSAGMDMRWRPGLWRWVRWRRMSYVTIRYLFTPWAIKKRVTFIFTITLANVDRFQ